MKVMKIKQYKTLFLAGALAFGASSCQLLDLAPIDYFGGDSYWKTASNVSGFVDALHKQMRDIAFQHSIVYGELRGDIYSSGVGTDGSTLSYGTLTEQNLSFDNIGGPAGFGNIFGKITGCNLIIAKVEGQNYISNELKNYFLAQAYGIRAFLYFELHRVYGGVPLRTGIEVIEGERDPNKLYLPRATPKVILEQIKSDVEKSMELFGDNVKFANHGQESKAYWTKAATEALAADVYLWSAKVTTKWTTEIDGAADLLPNPEDISLAKAHLLSLKDNYGLELQTEFSRVFDATNKANSEIIFAIRYQEGEATNGNGSYLYSTATGQTNSVGFRADGQRWDDPLVANSYNAYQIKNSVWDMYSNDDRRKDATFMMSYDSLAVEGLVPRGSFVVKNIGRYDAANNQRIYDGDYIYYRLAWVYLSLAEVANFEGNKSDVETYINLVRQRAYGDSWDVTKHGYTASDFTTNEFAILDEKTKEFVQEGQRWWDLRRMTSTKGGDPVVFDVRASMDKTTPILDKSTEEYKLLWPIDQGIINNDPKIKQTPGY